MGQLDGKVALITGSGSGIGRATASIMAKRGADIVIQDINESGANETAAQVRALGRRAEAYVGDVSNVPRIRQIVADAEAAFGHIDILVNNAGVASDLCPLEEVTVEMFERSFAVHVKGAVFTTQAVVPGMKHRRTGKIVNISSMVTMIPFPNAATYNGAKGAVLAMAKGWAKEFAPWNICVNIVSPGYCRTPMVLDVQSSEMLAAKAKTVPFGRYGEPEEMASAIAFLASPEADFITGQVISPNGGSAIVGI